MLVGIVLVGKSRKKVELLKVYVWQKRILLISTSRKMKFSLEVS